MARRAAALCERPAAGSPKLLGNAITAEQRRGMYGPIKPRTSEAEWAPTVKCPSIFLVSQMKIKYLEIFTH